MDLDTYRAMLTEACRRYERTAPTVAAHCDDLYIRINEAPERVTLAELILVSAIWADEWETPNGAANLVYHARHRFGMDTTGHAGF